MHIETSITCHRRIEEAAFLLGLSYRSTLRLIRDHEVCVVDECIDLGGLLLCLGVPSDVVVQSIHLKRIFLTGSELAQRLGISSRTVSTYARGTRRLEGFPRSIRISEKVRLFFESDLQEMEFGTSNQSDFTFTPVHAPNDPAESVITELNISTIQFNLEELIPRPPKNKRVRKK
ncbi:helix-turn-helix transcriptional regulator [Paragemmobacter straminiformis]|uniref:Uncharacterized protein n=1 Tax=Paragemmobacter straminiformis TaxID=2045119 RepID=A0A842I6A4_9RHOB|nr:hypothetical protein [Gemmobacter straminiformis]MBC2835156.1 hypothetical protein [Gemmobacter straminiformis]